MKKIIATLLIPITALILLFEKVIEAALAISQPIVDGLILIVEKNYNFWKQIFKWKDGE